MDTSLYTLDTLAFTRLGEQRAGELTVSQLSRATEGLPSQKDQVFTWSAQGRVDSTGRAFIHLKIDGYMMLSCQRCMKPMQWPVQVDNHLEVVTTEAELDLDEEDVEGPDRILASTRFDLFELIEDEIILALPYVARHDECPSLPEGYPQEDEPDFTSDKPNPFAVLSKLKKP
ncbi:MAG TPA: DUF177 domain-containing protein [Candidatus Paenalcaligenes intestinipullorum]|uniref:Large ribosomal RNA subunit accumulation protein YceD n=1 Tax=Candidatus Paenalcaligenes intestinipullorum TaxID=2838718 RepID=A0A9D2RIP8_9BURK|nr:DUF177 domain-containing protein [Candidatus Paenalcaligenes intestinipullorum]